MANVTILPPSAQVQGVPAGGQPAQNTTGAPTPSLPPGTVISGTIIGKDNAGNFLLRTTQGTIPIRSSTPLTYNSDVTVRIDQAPATGTNARILSVNGQPFDAFAAPDPEATDVVNTPVTAASEPQAQGESLINAVVVSAPSSTTQLAAGASVILRVSPADQTATHAGSGQSAFGANATASESTPQNVTRLLAPQPQQNLPALEPQTAGTTGSGTQVSSSASTAADDIPVPANQTPATENTPAAIPSATLYAVYAKQPATSAPIAPQDSANASSAQGTPTGTAAATGQEAASAPAAVSANPTVIQGQVANAASDGNITTITVQTQVGNITVKAEGLPSAVTINLVPAAQVAIEIPAASSSSSLILTAQTLTSAPAPAAELASTWQTLADILSVVSNTSQSAANAALARLPQLGPEFVASSTAFVTAAMAGNVRALLGDDVLDILAQKGRNDLVQKFTNELSDMSQLMNPAPGTARPAQGWQTIFLPFVYQAEVQQARMYVKRDNAKKSKTGSGQAAGDTRFVVEVDLSELGPMQMDGLIRPKPAASTVFDLVIRSTTPFSGDAQAEMTAIFNNASQLTGFKGSVSFQVTRNFPVKPLDEALEGAKQSITV